jgi:hypothetical protein
LVSKPEGKVPLGTLVHKQVDNVEVDLKEVGYEEVD